jgi:hypothetical protein
MRLYYRLAGTWEWFLLSADERARWAELPLLMDRVYEIRLAPVGFGWVLG